MKALPMILTSLVCGAFAPLAGAQNVSVNAVISGQILPGVYGQVAIGNNVAPPPLVYAQPMVAVAPPVVEGVPPLEPIYLHVPPGHAKHWRKHCHEYNACYRPVYFVRSAEYDPGYYRRHDEGDQGEDHDRGRGHWHRHEHGDHGNHGDHDD